MRAHERAHAKVTSFLHASIATHKQELLNQRQLLKSWSSTTQELDIQDWV
jgi:hypothetical protein